MSNVSRNMKVGDMSVEHLKAEEISVDHQKAG